MQTAWQKKQAAMKEHREAIANYEHVGYHELGPTIVAKFTMDGAVAFGSFSPELPPEFLPMVVAGMMHAIGEDEEFTSNFHCKPNPDNTKSISIHTDTYIDKGDTVEECMNTDTDLNERWDQHDPHVREALTSMVITPEQVFHFVTPYRWTPVDGWEWDKTMTMAHPNVFWKEIFE